MSAVASPALRQPAVDIFDARHYAEVRKPLAEASTLPPWAYTSEEFYRREVQTIWMKEWNFFGRADRIPNPGDYFSVDFVGVPIVVVRGKDGQVRAFSNSCRHRGAAMLRGDGNCNAIRCPYHSWSYDFEGKLIVAPDMEQTAGFRLEDFPLVPLKLELWAGFIFINLDPDAGPLKDYLVDLPEVLASYNFDNMVCVRRKEYTIEANWKIYVENAMEAYHVATVHRSTLSRQKGVFPSVESSKGQWMALHKEHEGTRALLTGDTGFPRIPDPYRQGRQGQLLPAHLPEHDVRCDDRLHVVAGTPAAVGVEDEAHRRLLLSQGRHRPCRFRGSRAALLQALGYLDPGRQRHLGPAADRPRLPAVPGGAPLVRRAAGPRIQQLGPRPGPGSLKVAPWGPKSRNQPVNSKSATSAWWSEESVGTTLWPTARNSRLKKMWSSTYGRRRQVISVDCTVRKPARSNWLTSDSCLLTLKSPPSSAAPFAFFNASITISRWRG